MPARGTLMLAAVAAVAGLMFPRPDSFGEQDGAAPDAKTVPLRSDAEPTDNYLWLLSDDGPPPSRTAARLRDQLGKCRVADIEQAEKVAYRYRFSQGGCYADERLEVAALVGLARTAPGFGDKGDFVWIVNDRRYGHVTDTSYGGIQQCLWISATTAEVIAVLP